MKQRFTKLLAAVALLVFMMPSVAGWGQTKTVTPNGTFIIDFYDETKLNSTSGTGLTNNNYSSFVSVPEGVNATDVVTSVSVTGTVRYGMNGGLTAGTGTAASADSHYVTFTISSDYKVTKCTVYATKYEDGRWKLNGNVAASGSLGDKGATIDQVTDPLIWNSSEGMTTLTFKKDNGNNGNQKRLTIYRIVCEYGTGGTPTCTVDPESWDFGSMQVGSAAQTKTFTVTTANLEHGMGFYLDNYDYFNITNNATGFSATTTTYDITVSFNPTAVGTHTANLILEGDDFEDDIEVPLTATVVSNDPTCTINPTTWDFGNVALGMSATKEFTVTTANLTGVLTLAMSESVYSVTPATIAQNATTTTVTVTFAPTEDGEVDDVLSITGGGLESATTAIVSGTGYQAQTYTITFDAGSGTCTTETMTGVSGSEITLPTAIPSQACQDAGWTFAGWATTSVGETTTAPTLLSGSYTITSNATLYAVYQLAATQVTTFNIATIATNNNWTNATQYSSINIDPVTLTATGGGNDGKYYSSDQTWRFYKSSGGTLTVTSNNNVIQVTSTPSKEFAINNGTATYTAATDTKFKEIVVTTVSGITYHSTPACQEKVATPVITLDEGTYTSVQTTTITCATEDATIFYTTDGSIPTAESTEYTGAVTIDQSMTIKAIAVKEGMDDSDEASATYTINLPLSTIDEIFAQATINGGTAKTVTVTFGDWVVSGVSGNNVYVTDNNGKGFIIYKKDHGFAVDDKLSGTVADTPLKLYNGSAEFTNLTASTSGLSVTHDGEITVLTNETIDDLGGVNTGAVITLSNLTFDGTYLTDGTNEIKPYTTLYDYETSFVSGPSYNVTGVYLQYNTDNSETKEILPRSAADIEQVSTLNITGYSNGGGWNLIASPVVSIDPVSAGMITDEFVSTNVTPDNGTYDLYRFNQSAELEWENYRVHSFALESGKGYLYASKEGVSIQFVGTPYNSNGEIPLVYDEGKEFAGWNLIGNPFANATTFTTSDTETGDVPELNFLTMNENGDCFITTTSSSFNAAAFQGFFVQATGITQQLQVEESGGSKTANLNIAVSRNHGNLIDNAIVNFGNASMMKKFYLSNNTTRVYIPQDNREMAVVHSTTEAEMPVNFKASENGTYTLAVEAENVEMNYLHLIDNMTGMDVDLLQTPSYTFDATTNDYTSRFRLVFSANDVNEQNAETFAFFSNGNWVVNNEGEATLQVIDVNGRIVSNETINGTVATSINATPGVYMLRLVNGNEVKTQKIVVR